MSFGSPTPIEVAVSGPNLAVNREFAEKMREQLADDSRAARPAVRPVARLPDAWMSTVDRERAGLLGVKMGDVVALAGRGHVVEPLHRAELLGRSRTAASATRCRSRSRRRR